MLDKIKKDIDFCKDAKWIQFNPNFLPDNILIDSIIKSNKTNILLFCGNEALAKNYIFEAVLDIINTFVHHQIKIMHASASEDDIFIHPLVSLNLWGRHTNSVPLANGSADEANEGADESSETEVMFPIGDFDYTKNNYLIASVRRSDYLRSIFMDTLTTNIKIPSILRHIGIGDRNPRNVKSDEFPTWTELQEEYRRSYISVIFETITSSPKSYYLRKSMLTDKTILGFYTKTIPIIYGSRSYLKELKELGFWTANEDLGFTKDAVEHNDKIKIEEFNNLLKRVGSMSTAEIESFYNKNYTKINKNYEILINSLSYDIEYPSFHLI
jgi:hypothetical protein